MNYTIETTPGKIQVRTKYVVKHKPKEIPGVNIKADTELTTKVEGENTGTRTFEVDTHKFGNYFWRKRISPTSIGVFRLVKAMYQAAKNATLTGDFSAQECSEINSQLDAYDQTKARFKKVARVKDVAKTKEVISVDQIPEERLEELLR